MCYARKQDADGNGEKSDSDLKHRMDLSLDSRPSTKLEESRKEQRKLSLSNPPTGTINRPVGPEAQ